MIDLLLPVLTVLLLITALISLGIALGRRDALARHQCPPRFTTDQLFALQDREWENRGQKRYDIVNVHNASGRHRADSDIRRHQHSMRGPR